MHVPPFLTELVLVFGMAVLVVLVLSRLRFPTITGFIAAGALAGPSGLALVGDGPEGMAQITALAEIGVVLLLFTIGLEFSFGRLRRIWRPLALGGTLQVGLTTLMVTAVATLGFGEPGTHAVFFGFLVAMSSTALVLRALAERRELDAPHGRLMVGVLVFQDLCIVPMMLVVPMLAGGAGADATGVAAAIGTAAALVAGTLLLGRLIAPRAFALVAATRQRELFVLAVLLACVGIAWLTTLVGLSLALGAFLAGVALADSEYGQQALADALPFREVFTSLFFISIGMLFDVDVVLASPMVVLGFVALVLLGKALLAGTAAAAIGFPLRVAVLAGVGLAGIGEFSFVLASAGTAAGLLTEEQYRLFVAVTVITVVVTPIAFRVGPHLAAGAARLRPLERMLGARGADEEEVPEAVHGHVIIAGYGVAARLLVEALEKTGVSYRAVELNPEAVRAARARGEHVVYGDATSAEIYLHLGIARARELLVLVNDPDAARRAVTIARRLAPSLVIRVRTKYVAEVEPLRALGATDVIVEEFETAMEIVARVLRGGATPSNVIREQVGRLRKHGSPMERPLTVAKQILPEVAGLKELKVETFLVREAHWIAANTLADLHLFAAGACFVVALGREGRIFSNPKAFESPRPGDVLYLVIDGTRAEDAQSLLEKGPGDGVE